MKLTIERAALLKALSHVQSVVERRTTIPILSNVLLHASSGKLAMSATDMDLEIVESVPARIDSDGRTTAPAHTLYDIVRKLRDGAQVELETATGSGAERNEMVLRSGRSTFTLSCLPPEDYPGDDDRRVAASLHANRGRAARADRPYPVRNFDRGDALLPERHLPARDQKQ